MSDGSIDYTNLLATVEQVMRICVQAIAMSEGLASLLIHKGLVTRVELDARILEQGKESQKLAETLGSGSNWRLRLGIAAGFLLSIWLFQIARVRANPQEPGQVHVYIRPMEMSNAHNAAWQNVSGGAFVGISCIAKPTPKLPDAAVCYVATALA